MKIGFRTILAVPLFLASMGVGILPAQTQPPEATTKVKRVLLYNLIGGWYCGSCRDKVQEVFFHIAQSKGFSVDTTSSVSALTLENLKRYQVIVWNNNSNGGQSVPDVEARKAVSEYVRQGGGWMLVNIANDHNRTWSFLDSLIGPGTGGWNGGSITGDLVVDSAAQKHPELRYFTKAMPDTIRLQTNWLNVMDISQDMNHITPIYRLKNIPWNRTTQRQDHYVWAATQEQGKALALPLGWHNTTGTNTNLMPQADSAVPRLYWQGLRWLAGDFQAGCTNPAMANFNPEARVDDGSCPTTGIRIHQRQTPPLFAITGRRVRFPSPVLGGNRMRVLDLRGHTVGSFIVPESTNTFDLPTDLRTGLYLIEAIGAGTPFQARILIP